MVWHVVKEFAAKLGVSKLAPHDLRRVLRPSGVIPQAANWNKSNFCWVTFQCKTTEKYLGCKQRLRGAVNDRIGIEPAQ